MKERKNKYDFIQEILESKKLTVAQRERVLLLASKEMSFEGTLEERIQKIENIIYEKHSESQIITNNILDLIPPENSKVPNYIHPYQLFKFLFEYNQNPVLRSTCHDIDSDSIQKINEYCKTEVYDYSKHLDKIIEAFNEHEKNYFGGGKVNALIRVYLTGKVYKGNEQKEGWTTDKIKVNWSSPELIEWTKKHLNTPPNINQDIAANQEIELFPLNPQLNSELSSLPIQNFTQLVLHFKNLFHLKSGQQSLKLVLERVNHARNWKKKIEIEFDESNFYDNLEHFTDVNRLIQAYNKILQLIVDQHGGEDKPRVNLRFYEKDKNIYFSIHHQNSVYNKTIQNTIDRLGQTYSNLIDKQLNGLCNFILKADFGNGNYSEINLWDGKIREAKKLNSFTGVEHIFEFIKSENATITKFKNINLSNIIEL